MARPPSDADYAEFVHGVWPRLYRTAYLLIGDHATAETWSRRRSPAPMRRGATSAPWTPPTAMPARR